MAEESTQDGVVTVTPECRLCRWVRAHKELQMRGAIEWRVLKCHYAPPPFPEVQPDDFCREFDYRENHE